MAHTPKKGATPKNSKYSRGSIVPSKCGPRKSKKSQIVKGAPLPQKIGFEVQDASGNTFLLNDWPATGGPWGPAISSTTGAFVWVNLGG